MKKSILLGMAAACALVLGACGGSKASDSKDTSDKASGKQVLNLASASELPTMDLSLSSDIYSSAALNECYEGLYRQKGNRLEPAGAAEKPEIKNDGLTYIFKLNKKAKWSNGDPVTADDYVYGWQRTVDPKTASDFAYIFESVKNAKDIEAGKKEPSELGIKALSDYELEVDLDTATPYFESLLTCQSFFPQHQATVEKYGKDYALTSNNAIYNGPFKLANFDGPGTDTEWAYVKNNNYWDKKNVKLDKIELTVVKEASTRLNMFQDGQLDEASLSGELAQQNANDPHYISVKKATTSYMEMNQRKADSPFRNENLRKAISCAIDRKSLVNNIVSNGSVTTSELVPSGFAYDAKGKDFVEQTDAKVNYNADKAKEYWAKAQKELGISSLKFDILTDDSDGSKKIAEYLQGAIQDTLKGVTTTVTIVPFSVRVDRSNKGEFDTFLGSWGAEYNDPYTYLGLFVTGSTKNRGQWRNEEYDKLVNASATTDANDAGKRWQDMIDAENIITKHVGVIPIYQQAGAYLRNAKVKGVVNNTGSFEYKWAYIDSKDK